MKKWFIVSHSAEKGLRRDLQDTKTFETDKIFHNATEVIDIISADKNRCTKRRGNQARNNQGKW